MKQLTATCQQYASPVERLQEYVREIDNRIRREEKRGHSAEVIMLKDKKEWIRDMMNDSL